ncbi:hypothetical protein C2E23DRAFT_414822 [Lenzites betulinus]|nr:hypothetical protein C2E23DRAFT_414822 [Lenzites betulinus]
MYITVTTTRKIRLHVSTRFEHLVLIFQTVNMSLTIPMRIVADCSALGLSLRGIKHIFSNMRSSNRYCKFIGRTAQSFVRESYAIDGPDRKCYSSIRYLNRRTSSQGHRIISSDESRLATIRYLAKQHWTTRVLSDPLVSPHGLIYRHPSPHFCCRTPYPLSTSVPTRIFGHYNLYIVARLTTRGVSQIASFLEPCQECANLSQFEPLFAQSPDHGSKHDIHANTSQAICWAYRR